MEQGTDAALIPEELQGQNGLAVDRARDVVVNDSAELVRVLTQVRGVGFRPTVCRIARQLGLPGWVRNDNNSVLIVLGGDAQLHVRFWHALLTQLPQLAQVWSLAAHPVLAEGSRLGIEQVRGVGRCPQCQREIVLELPLGICPCERAALLERTSGDELIVTELEVDDVSDLRV